MYHTTDFLLALLLQGKRGREDTEVEDCITRKKPSEEDRCFVQILTLRPKDVYVSFLVALELSSMLLLSFHLDNSGGTQKPLPH